MAIMYTIEFVGARDVSTKRKHQSVDARDVSTGQNRLNECFRKEFSCDGTGFFCGLIHSNPCSIFLI